MHRVSKYFIRRNIFKSFENLHVSNLTQLNFFSSKKHPVGYWKNFQHHRDFFDALGKHLNLKSWQDWYQVSLGDIEEFGGSGLLSSYYHNSPLHALTTVYPEHKWEVLKFANIPSGTWKELSNQRAFFEQLSKTLNISNWEDWYHVTKEKIIENGGIGVLSQYDHSLAKALQTVFPENQWQSWRFHQVPHGYWNDFQNQRQFFERLQRILGYSKWEDWYQLQFKDIVENGGETLISEHYGGSPARALTNVFPEYPWKLWKFLRPPEDAWKNVTIQREFMDFLASEFRMKSWDEWYKVTPRDISLMGGGALLAAYGGNHVKAIMQIYPERAWLPAKFLPNTQEYGIWKDVSRHREIFEHIGKSLNIQNWEDWYSVSAKNVKAISTTILTYYGGSLIEALKAVYPDHPWTSERRTMIDGALSRTQFRLFTVVKDAFPGSDIHLNYVHPLAKYPESKIPIEFDVFIPMHNIAFEYHGQQHYHNNPLYESLEIRQRKDLERRTVCKNTKITLIEVPYWWDEMKPSLLATIHKVRPDLIPDPGSGSPIEDRFAINKQEDSKPISPRIIDGSSGDKDDLPAYYVAYGNKKGTPSCRGCGKLFEDKTELRILTTMMWTTPHSTKSTPVRINFCLNSVCVQQGIMKRYSKGKKKISPVETFDGRIGVGPEVNRNELPTNDLLHYVFLDKSPTLQE